MTGKEQIGSAEWFCAFALDAVSDLRARFGASYAGIIQPVMIQIGALADELGASPVRAFQVINIPMPTDRLILQLRAAATLELYMAAERERRGGVTA